MTDGVPVRSLAVLTTGRQDWGILRSVCLRAPRRRDRVRLDVVAGGMHLSAALRRDRRGRSAPTDSRRCRARPGSMPKRPTSDEAADALRGGRGPPARGAPGRARHRRATGSRRPRRRSRRRSSGCRSSISTAASRRDGAFDDALRHAITKLAHLHLVSDEVYGAAGDRDGRGSGGRARRRRPGPRQRADRPDLPDRADAGRGTSASNSSRRS